MKASCYYGPKGKKIVAFAMILATSVVSVSAQTVSFRNNDVYATIAERRVFDADGRPLVGSNYLAQLYYGPLGTAPGNLIPHTSAPTRFRNITPTEPFAGTWVGATRTLTGMSLGQTVTLQV